MQQWTIIPQNTPAVIRQCSQCGEKQDFISSGKFRVNANGSQLDVWLIYQCGICQKTWNMEILSRVSPKSIPPETYQGFLENSRALAEYYAFDMNTQKKNKAVLNESSVEYDIEVSILEGGQDRIKICSEYNLNLRLDVVIAKAMGMTRSQTDKLFREKQVWSRAGQLSKKQKVKKEMEFSIENGVQPAENVNI